MSLRVTVLLRPSENTIDALEKEGIPYGHAWRYLKEFFIVARSKPLTLTEDNIAEVIRSFIDTLPFHPEDKRQLEVRETSLTIFMEEIFSVLSANLKGAIKIDGLGVTLRSGAIRIDVPFRVLYENVFGET